MKRINKIDILKGLAIVCVVFGHAIQLYNGAVYRNEQLFYSNLIYKTIYTFHMPLFMLISGYLFSISYQKDNSFKMIRTKVISYGVPIIVFAVLKTLLQMFGKGLSFYWVKDITYNIFHTLWFLWALIYACVSIWIFEKVNHKIIKNVLCVLATVLLFVTPDVLMSNVFKYTIPYFFAGYYVQKKSLKFNKWKYWLSLPIWILMTFFYKRIHYIYISGINLNVGKASVDTIIHKLIFIDLYRYAIGLVGCLAICKIVTIICKWEDKFIVKIISRLGKNTLGIYILTTEILNEIIYKVFQNYSYDLFRTIVISVVVLIISDLVTEVISKTKYLKFLLLGKR